MRGTVVGCLASITCFLFASFCDAATIQTLGVGSAVTSIDRSATFDGLTSSANINLDNYAEGGLRVTTGSTSWGEDPSLFALDPFHGANGTPPGGFYAMANGSDAPVTIQTSDHKLIYAVEFMYGNTWTTGDIGPSPPHYPWGNHSATLDWETWKGGVMISSGTVGDSPLLEMGTTVGFFDPAGFDQLLVSANIAGNPGLQAIALDNLDVQVSAPIAGAPGPIAGAGLPGLLVGVGAMLAWYRKRRAAV